VPHDDEASLFRFEPASSIPLPRAGVRRNRSCKTVRRSFRASQGLSPRPGRLRATPCMFRLHRISVPRWQRTKERFLRDVLRRRMPKKRVRNGRSRQNKFDNSLSISVLVPPFTDKTRTLRRLLLGLSKQKQRLRAARQLPACSLSSSLS
jgi:hypothetical protein